MKKVDEIEKLLSKLKNLIEATFDDKPEENPNPFIKPQQMQNLGDLGSSLLESSSQQPSQ